LLSEPLNLAAIILGFTGLLLIIGYLALLLSMNPTPFMRCRSSLDHIISPLLISPFPVH